MITPTITNTSEISERASTKLSISASELFFIPISTLNVTTTERSTNNTTTISQAVTEQPTTTTGAVTETTTTLKPLNNTTVDLEEMHKLINDTRTQKKTDEVMEMES
jgi:hypothetical protein